jgi:hypothetical protein
MRQYSDVPSPRQVETAREPCVSNSFAAMPLSPRLFPDARVFSKFNSGDLKNSLRQSANPFWGQRGWFVLGLAKCRHALLITKRSSCNREDNPRNATMHRASVQSVQGARLAEALLKLYRTGPKKWLCSFARLCGSYLSMYGTEEVRAAGKGSADRIIRRPYFCAHMRQTFDQLQAFSEGDCKRLRTSNIAGARSVW